MRQTPKRTYAEIERERPACERRVMFADHACRGRSTMEHAWIYAGRQITDKWAIIRICEWAHGVGRYVGGDGLDKEMNQYIALTHATPADLAKYPNRNWVEIKNRLEKKYGTQREARGPKVGGGRIG